MEAETGGMWPQAKGLRQPPGAARGTDRTLPQSLWREQAWPTLDLVPVVPDCGRVHFCRVKLPA